MTIGERIKALRESNKMTQTDLAERIGTTKQNVYKYENGIITNIPSDKIEQIAKLFDVSPAYIMGWTEKSAPIKHDRNAVINRINSLSDDQFEKFAAKAEGYLDGLEDQ